MSRTFVYALTTLSCTAIILLALLFASRLDSAVKAARTTEGKAAAQECVHTPDAKDANILEWDDSVPGYLPLTDEQVCARLRFLYDRYTARKAEFNNAVRASHDARCSLDGLSLYGSCDRPAEIPELAPFVRVGLDACASAGM